MRPDHTAASRRAQSASPPGGRQRPEGSAAARSDSIPCFASPAKCRSQHTAKNRHSPNRHGHAGFPHVARRLDVKVYPPCMRACAVNYFTGSGLFNRMLRYWCDRPTAAVAARAATHLPGGAVFHLSDRCLAVRPLPHADFAAASAGAPPVPLPPAAARTAEQCRACSLIRRAVTGTPRHSAHATGSTRQRTVSTLSTKNDFSLCRHAGGLRQCEPLVRQEVPSTLPRQTDHQATEQCNGGVQV